MATKRKTGAGKAKAAKPQKKTTARPAPAKKTIQAKAKSKAAAVKAKPAKPVKAIEKPAKAVKAVKPAVVKAATEKPATEKPAKPAKPAKVVPLKVKPVKPPAVVRPIGALPPEAVARAMQKAPTPVAPRPSRPAVVPTSRPTTEEGAAGVTEKDYKEFEQRLMSERQKILKEMGHLENTVLKVNQRDSAGDLSGYSFHMADVGTDAMEREKAFLFASNEGALLKEIDEALRKVYGGEFGVCENCTRPIGRARLEAMPYARLCLSCKEAEERTGRGAS
ncbi:MAG TPA: TraR/DksA C4-type zinc finger protein [Candidatus Eisenbacteria bacterium]|nr:TraR/DksA C4-type zinc finger protein [Candidatus Eisenbacteria bacterium]